MAIPLSHWFLVSRMLDYQDPFNSCSDSCAEQLRNTLIILLYVDAKDCTIRRVLPKRFPPKTQEERDDEIAKTIFADRNVGGDVCCRAPKSFCQTRTSRLPWTAGRPR